MALHLKSNVILMVTTGGYMQDALDYADEMMQLTTLYIIILEGCDLLTLTRSPTAIVGNLSRKARRIMELKALPD